MCHRIGLPPISTIGFGRSAVSSDRREPRPPARMMAFNDAVCGRLVTVPSLPGCHDALGRSHGEGGDGKGRIHASARYEGAAVGDEQVWHLVRASGWKSLTIPWAIGRNGAAWVRLTSAWNSVRRNGLSSWRSMRQNALTSGPPLRGGVEACRPQDDPTAGKLISGARQRAP